MRQFANMTKNNMIMAKELHHILKPDHLVVSSCTVYNTIHTILCLTDFRKNFTSTSLNDGGSSSTARELESFPITSNEAFRFPGFMVLFSSLVKFISDPIVSSRVFAISLVLFGPAPIPDKTSET